MGDSWAVPIVLGVLTLAGAVAGSWATYRSARRAERAAPYDALAERVEILERHYDELRGGLASFTDLVRPLISWIDDGAQAPPPPIPERLRHFLHGTWRRRNDDI